jgi:hypothetical protein
MVLAVRPRISDEATVQQVEAFYIDKYGEPSRSNALSGDGLNIDIYVWDSKSPDGVTLYFTLGGSGFPRAGFAPTQRLELLTGFDPPTDAVDKALASSIQYAISDKPVAGGHTLTLPEPLWPGSEMNSFLFIESGDYEPLYLGKEVVVSFLMAVPIFSEEIEHLRRVGEDAFLDSWERASVPYWDPHRRPYVGT